MFLKCVVLFLTFKIILSCHIERRSGQKSYGLNSSEKSTAVNESVDFRRNENRPIDSNNGSFDKILPQKPALRNIDIPIDKSANREELIEKGRFLKKRLVVTCDGFVLSIFRLTGDVKPYKIPVLLMHGLFQSSDKFAKQSKDQSLAFKLQDLGYDVWLGNLRGNKHSRHHFYLDPEEQKEEFFNSSYEEMGVYDLAATVDFVLNQTSHTQLHYISHSIGGTVFLVLNSLEPQYNEKFKGAHLMAPIGYQTNFPTDNKLRDEAMKVHATYNNLIKDGVVEIFPYTKEDTKFSPDECLGNNDENLKHICTRLNIEKKMELNKKDNGIISTRGGSIKQLAHLAQNVKSKLFDRWNYGEKENENRYGTKIPPEYILSHVTVPTVIIFANDDEFVSPKDIIDMASDMGNATARAAERNNFTHEDFVTAPDVYKAVYEDVIKDLEMEQSEEDEATSTFYKRYFWPMFILLIIIIAILLCVIIYWCCKKRKQGLRKSSHKSTQTVATVAPSRLEYLPPTREFSPVAPYKASHISAPTLPLTRLYTSSSRIEHLPKTSEHSPDQAAESRVIHIPTTSAADLSAAPLPSARLHAASSRVEHLPTRGHSPEARYQEADSRVVHLPSTREYSPVAPYQAADLSAPLPTARLLAASSQVTTGEYSPVADLAMTPKHSPATSKHITTAREHLPLPPSPVKPVKPLPLKPFPAPPLQASVLAVEQVPPCHFDNSSATKHLPVAQSPVESLPATRLHGSPFAEPSIPVKPLPTLPIHGSILPVEHVPPCYFDYLFNSCPSGSEH